MRKLTRPTFYYGYVIVVVAILIMFILHGVGRSWGVFLNSLESEFGWSRAAISGAHSLGFIMGGLFSVLFGRISDRFGARAIMTVGGISFSLGCFLMSRVSTLWQVYLFYGMLMTLWGSPANVSLLSTAMRWFSRKRGLISGIAKVGTGLGIMIVPLLATQLTEAYGWRQTFIILGIICLIIVIPLAQLLRRNPVIKDIRLHSGVDVVNNGREILEEGLNPRQAIRKKQFWVICVSFFLMWYCCNGLMIHVIPYSTDIGIPPVAAAGLLSIIGAASILGRLVVGAAGDKVGNIRTMTFCFILLIVSMSWLLISEQMWQFYLFAIVYGFSHGGFFTLISPLIAELFGTRAHGTLFGIISFIGMTGGAIGPLVAGRIFDVTGTYSIAFLLIIGFAVVGLLLSLMLKPIRQSVY